ncbi:cytochrome c-type biogenesis protein DsbD protein-disulfide reductase [Vibrio maritimus]|uniref:Cytochrome c-type biogenesis protein DsbD protein-disulfide reductase n=1 Tax=Vibrio maritimus TaxID=990268 RepID=A0A090TBA0_9VIBR|nr:cytochrome c-type biogenesis protein DsbD protein-disulfide reductase [Vibrio maritimus]
MTRLFSQFLLLSLTTLALPSWALFGDNNTGNAFTPSGTNTFVPVDQAFPMNAYQQGDRVFIDWQVKPDYYLYQDRLSFSGENVTLGNIELQQGEPYTDEFFGDVTIYTQPLFVEVPLSQYQAGAKLIVQYQGCAKAGFCYPPETRVIDITPFSLMLFPIPLLTPNRQRQLPQTTANQQRHHSQLQHYSQQQLAQLPLVAITT